MKFLFAVTALAALSSNFAQAESAYIQAYKRNDNSYQLYCEVYDQSNYVSAVKALDKTIFRKGKYLFRKFELDTRGGSHEFSLQVYNNNRGHPNYQVVIDGQKLNGEVEEGATRYYKKRMLFKHNLLSKVTCYAEFAIEPNFQLADGKYHINVHPHDFYDFRNLTTTATNALYKDTTYKSALLLDDGNFKENLVRLSNFLTTGLTNLPIKSPGIIRVTPADNTDLLVSPAGHNRYQMDATREVSVTYTGGNHNYCIWNNTRRVFNALMESNTNPVVNIIYQQNAIVVQKSGILGGGMSFGRRSRIGSTNLLATLMQDYSVQQAYHTTYFGYFASNYFGYYSHRFSEVHLNYIAPQFKKQTLIRGTGQRVITINMLYK